MIWRGRQLRNGNSARFVHSSCGGNSSGNRKSINIQSLIKLFGIGAVRTFGPQLND